MTRTLYLILGPYFLASMFAVVTPAVAQTDSTLLIREDRDR